MKYTVRFTGYGSPEVVSSDGFGMVLSHNPLGKLPEKETADAALLAAIEYGEKRISDGRERLSKASELNEALWRNTVLLLAQEIRATHAMQALNAARKHWTKK